MATFPYFVLGPNAILSLYGFYKGPDKTIPTPVEDWRKAKVDVVIPAYNEEHTIILCLESLLHQTLKPNRIIMVDDGSKDRTSELVRDFVNTNNIPLEIVRHHMSVGKTPGIKHEARALDGDVEFILDGDTILDSPNYIERVVQELYQGVGIASACGTIQPMRIRDRHRVAENERVKLFYETHPTANYLKDHSRFHRMAQGWTNMYRDFLYYTLQHLIYRGQMALFGGIINPVGCAVAYRRKYLKELFDKYESILGDNLTTSEDIFIGFAMNEQGYRNIQVPDVIARSEEPEAQKLPRQLHLWSSSFLQSCYYFPKLLFSPFKTRKRVKHMKAQRESGIENKRLIKEAYRQPFGRIHTKTYGRPIGWAVFLALFEKISFPVVLIVMIAFQMWEALIITLIFELISILLLTFIISKNYRLLYLSRALVSTPIRYMSLFFDTITMIRFLLDITLFRKTRYWRK